MIAGVLARGGVNDSVAAMGQYDASMNPSIMRGVMEAANNDGASHLTIGIRLFTGNWMERKGAKKNWWGNVVKVTDLSNKYMNLPLFAWVLIAAVALAGCAKPNVWTKSGMNQERFDQDFAKCRREASMSTQTLHADGDTGLERSFMQDSIVKKCMYAKGYELK